MKYEFLMGMETAQGVGFTLMEFVVYTGGIGAVEDYFQTISEITTEDVRNAAREFLVDTSKTIIKLTSEQEVES